MKPKWKWMQTVGADEIGSVLRVLPQDVKRRADEVPIFFDRRPGRRRIADGITEDTLGVFRGSSALDGPAACPLPAQIILFLETIWDAAGGEERLFRREIRTTFLHELGHALGWDEAALAARNLD